jgi:hypothetical protein
MENEMQHQLVTLAHTVQYLGGRYLAARVVSRDGWRSVMHYAPARMPWPNRNDETRDVSAREQAIAMFESAISPDGSAFDEINVLSIDAWREGDGWTWNNWFKRGIVTRREFMRECGDLHTRAGRRRAIRWFRENGYLSAESAGRVSIEDDQHNVIVCERASGMPLFAIEYGAVFH